MTTKTITVTEDAYEALKTLKERNESFSETILRISKRKPLSYFYGALSKENGERLEKTIKEMRKIRNRTHQKRLKQIVKGLKK